MSIFPVLNAVFVGILLVGLFCWNVWLLLAFGIFTFISILIFMWDTADHTFHYESAFWLFILSEIIIFGTLITCCLYFDACNYVNLSNCLEIPFLGCFLLLGSSITITSFHHLLMWKNSWMLLLFTILLGLMFVLLQILELNEIYVNIFDTSFHASSFCTVGLHFSHVFIGIVGLIFMFFIGVKSFGVYRCGILTWYWHFVDYVWLFVYTFVYVC